MPRPYLVGWGFALKVFVKSYRKSKIQRKFWRQLVKKKYYWFTDEERVESNKKCLGILGELGKIIFPQKTNKEIILEYCDNIQTGDIDYLQSCIDVRESLRDGGIRYYLDHCPSAYGLDDYIGLCEESADDNMSNQEKINQCERCWDRVLV
jgi:hypothetical protein